MWRRISLMLCFVMLSSSIYAQPMSYWENKKNEAQGEARQKLQKEKDDCDVCGKEGVSSKMYKCQKYGVGFYEGEFVRVHVDCMTPDYFVLEAPAGKSKFEFSRWMENRTRMERFEIARLFPFLDILDEIINWTINITFYKVKNKNNQKKYEIYKYEGGWKAREKQANGKYKFLKDIP